jgi:UDP-glucose 4-epimerase
VQVFGTDYPTLDGTGVRDYIHVVDLASAHLSALRYLRNGGASVTLNAGYGHGYSVRQVVAAMSRAAARTVPSVDQARRAGDPPELVADCARIGAILDWTPRLDDLDQICISALAWERQLLARRSAATNAPG